MTRPILRAVVHVRRMGVGELQACPDHPHPRQLDGGLCERPERPDGRSRKLAFDNSISMARLARRARRRTQRHHPGHRQKLRRKTAHVVVHSKGGRHEGYLANTSGISATSRSSVHQKLDADGSVGATVLIERRERRNHVGITGRVESWLNRLHAPDHRVMGVDAGRPTATGSTPVHRSRPPPRQTRHPSTTVVGDRRHERQNQIDNAGRYAYLLREHALRGYTRSPRNFALLIEAVYQISATPGVNVPTDAGHDRSAHHRHTPASHTPRPAEDTWCVFRRAASAGCEVVQQPPRPPRRAVTTRNRNAGGGKPSSRGS